MSSQQDDSELIERFFRQELSEDELLSFENRVRQNPDFSKEVILMRDIFYNVKMAARKDLKEELQEIQNEALSQPVKPYRPGFKKWLKWISGLVIMAVILIISYKLIDQHTIEKYKTKFFSEDTTSIENANSQAPGPESPTIIKDPSDSRYNNVDADLKLQVKDLSTFRIKRIGTDENGLYKYEIKADGKTHIVSSPNPDLSSELMKKKEESAGDTIISKPIIATEKNSQINKPDPIEGVDF